MAIMPVAPWMPDAAPLHGGGLNEAVNVIPLTASSYGPFQSPLVVSNCPVQVIDAFGVLDTNGLPWVFAGGLTSLWRYSVTANAWSNVSGTLSIPLAAPAMRWRFAQFKDEVIAVATLYQGAGGPACSAPLLFDMSATTPVFVVMATGAPNAQFVAVIKSFVFLGYTNESVGGLAPFRVWWSAINDPTNFPVPGSAAAQIVESDYNDSAGSLGQVTGLVSDLAYADGAILFAHGVQRVVYSGPPDIFQVLVAVGTKGCADPSSVVKSGQAVFYLGEDGFYSFDGYTPVPIGVGRVNQWFFDNWNQIQPPLQLARVTGFEIAQSGTVAWLFATGTSLVPNTILMYSRWFDRWSYALVTGGVAFSYFRPNDLTTRAAIFDTGNNLCLIGFEGGGAMVATVATTEVQPVPGGRAFVRTARPLTDGGAPSMQILTRDLLTQPQTGGAAVGINSRGEAPQRAGGRYMQAVVTQPAGAVWTHIEGVELAAMPAGTR